MFRNTIKSIVLAVAIGLFFTVSAFGQERDSFRVGAFFTDTSFRDLLNVKQNTQGLAAELDARIAGGLYAEFQYNRANLSDPVHVDTYSIGPKVSIPIFKGVVAPYGRALFGVTTTYNGDRAYTQTFGGGIDVLVGRKLGFRALGYDRVMPEGSSSDFGRVTAGVFVRF
jgi:hypothetical protein